MRHIEHIRAWTADFHLGIKNVLPREKRKIRNVRGSGMSVDQGNIEKLESLERAILQTIPIYWNIDERGLGKSTCRD